MSIIASINKMDKRYGWSLLGFLLAAIFGAISLYTEFIRDNRPRLRFELISDASVLDVREQLGSLEIIYDGRNIKKAKQSLRVVVIKISNVGSTDVLIGHYDQHSPLGFKISDGNLLRAEVLSTSNPYLQQALRIDTTVLDTVRFSPVIMESDEWFIVKSLILHSEGSRPSFHPIGKIAGIREIRLVDSTEATEAPTFFTLAFSGGPWVQAARLLAYFFGFILLIVVVVVPFAGLSSLLSKRRRRKHVVQFKSLTKRTLTEKDEYIFERYTDSDIYYLLNLKTASSNEGHLNAEIKKHLRRKRPPGHEWRDESRGMVVSSRGVPPSHIFGFGLPIEDMMKSGFLIEQDGRWKVNAELSVTLDEFLQFLKIKGVDYPEFKTNAREGSEQAAPADAQETPRG